MGEEGKCHSAKPTKPLPPSPYIHLTPEAKDHLYPRLPAQTKSKQYVMEIMMMRMRRMKGAVVMEIIPV